MAVGVNLLPNLISTPSQGGPWVSEWLHRYIQPMSSHEYRPGVWGSSLIFNQSLAGEGNRLFTADWTWTGKFWDVSPSAEAISPGTLKAIVYTADALLVVVALALWHRRSSPIRLWNSDGPCREVVEYGMVLILMVLLSPMSSKPHFSTLLLPGFCLARLTVYQRKPVLWILLGSAIAAATLSLSLCGDYVSGYAMLWGSVTWSTLFLLAGCAYLLWNDRGIDCSRQRPQVSIDPATHAAA